MSFLPKITRGTTLSLQGQRLIFQQALNNGHLLLIDERTGGTYQVHDEATGHVRLPTNSDIERALSKDQLQIVRDRFGPRGNQGAEPAPVDVDCEAIVKMDCRAEMRRFWVRKFDETPCALSDRALDKFIAEQRSEAREAGFARDPSPTSLRRWINLRGVPGERSLQAMVSRSGRVPRQRGFGPLVEKLITRVVAWYYAERGRTMRDAYGYLFAHISRMNGIRQAAAVRGSRPGRNLSPLKRPSFDTLRNRINRAECLETITAKFGEQEARRRHLVPKQAIAAKRILDLGILDHSVCDSVVVIHGEQSIPMGRPTIGVLMDSCSRCILAFIITFEPPSVHTITELIKRSNRPKPHLAERFPKAPEGASVYGKLHTLLMDKGIEGVGVSWRDSMLDVGISVRWTGVHEPQQKGQIERVIRTLNQLVFHRMAGAVPFGPDMMRKLDIDPSKDAVVTLEELHELVEEAINLYHYEIHSELNAQPLRIWKEQAERYGIDVLDDVSKLDQMVGITKYPCLLSRNGITVNGLVYRDEQKVGDLLDAMAWNMPKRQRRIGSATARVKVKFNPANLSTINVFNERTKRYVTLPAVDQTYTSGLSLWQHKQYGKWAELANMQFGTEEERMAARFALRQSIERAAPELKARARKAAARLLASPGFTGVGGNQIVVATAEPRHDGNGPIEVPHRPAAETRRDGGKVVRTPQRGRAARQANARRARQRDLIDTSDGGVPTTPNIRHDTFSSQSAAIQGADLRALAKAGGVPATSIGGAQL